MTTLLADSRYTVAVKPGQQLSVTLAATGVGSVDRLAEKAGDVEKSIRQLVAGETRTFGPFMKTEAFRINCVSGSLTFEVNDDAVDEGSASTVATESTWATLPAASTVRAGVTAFTTDRGLVVSDGSAWQLTSSGDVTQYATPAAAATVTIADNARTLIVDPADTIATLTVNMPLLPINRQRVTLAFDAEVTALTMAVPEGTTLKNPLTVAAITTFATWEYRTTGQTWWRVA